MTGTGRSSSPSTSTPTWIRFAGEAAVVAHEEIGSWFIDVAFGDEPQSHIGNDVVSMICASRLVERVGDTWRLTADGRWLAESLGIREYSRTALKSFNLTSRDRITTEEKIRNSPGVPAATSEASQPNLSETWSRYRETKRDDLRNELMEAYLPLVRDNAERIYAWMPDELDIDDLVSAGIFGLMDAIDHFDERKRVKFELYCARRIQGAILDDLRNLDWVPRLVHSLSRRLQVTQGALEAELGRTPTFEELARKMGVDVEEVESIYKDSRIPRFQSLSSVRAGSARAYGERGILIGSIEDPNATFERAVARLDFRDEISKLALSSHEKMLLVLYYQEAMSLKEVAAHLEVSESRASQMHSSILQRMRALVRQPSAGRSSDE